MATVDNAVDRVEDLGKNEGVKHESRHNLAWSEA